MPADNNSQSSGANDEEVQTGSISRSAVDNGNDVHSKSQSSLISGMGSLSIHLPMSQPAN